jgi:hypothetical protein
VVASLTVATGYDVSTLKATDAYATLPSPNIDGGYDEIARTVLGVFVV